MIELSPAERAAAEASFRRRLASCVPWTRKIAWQPELNIRADTYPTTNLFPEVRPSDREVFELRPGEYIDSPGEGFRYAVRINRRGRRLQTWWGPKLGDVLFDGDIEIPILFEREAGPPADPRQKPWRRFPWMSLTPGELLTLRPGTKGAPQNNLIITWAVSCSSIRRETDHGGVALGRVAHR